MLDTVRLKIIPHTVIKMAFDLLLKSSLSLLVEIVLNGQMMKPIHGDKVKAKNNFF